MDNLALAKKAYSGLEAAVKRKRKVGDYQPFFDLLANNVVLKSSLPSGTPLSGEFHGKQNVIDLLSAARLELIDDIQLEGPLEYVGNGECIVVLGAETYKIKKTGVTVRSNQFLSVLRFSDGMITEIVEIRDFAQLVDACRVGMQE